MFRQKNRRDFSFSLKEEIDLAIFISSGRTFNILTIPTFRDCLKIRKVLAQQDEFFTT